MPRRHQRVTISIPMTTLVADLNKSNELYVEMKSIFASMRHLTKRLNGRSPSSSMDDLMIFGGMRSTLENRLLTFKIRKPPAQMSILDYQLETCRLGAPLYMKYVFHAFQPTCPIVKKSKEHLKDLAKEGERRGFGNVDLQLRGAVLTWAPFMGGVVCLDEEEETWFAVRIVASMKSFHCSEPGTWIDMEGYLRDVSCAERLKTDECTSLWNRVQVIREIGVEQSGFPTFPIYSCVGS